jgi:hypothetical protein
MDSQMRSHREIPRTSSSPQRHKLSYEVTTGDYGSWWKPISAETIGYPSTPLSHLAKRMSPPRMRPTSEPLPRVRSPTSLPSAVPLYETAAHQISILAGNSLGQIRDPAGDYKFPSEDREKIGVVGYRGWYSGKKSGKVGTVETHDRPISQADPNSLADPSSMLNKSCFLESVLMPYGEQEELIMKSHPEAYHHKGDPRDTPSPTSVTALATPGRRQKGTMPTPVNMIEPRVSVLMREIQDKLARKFPDVFRRHRNLMLVFAGRDLHKAGVCSVAEFKHALRLLNIELKEQDFALICEEFRHHLDYDKIQYGVFVDAIAERERERPFRLSALTASQYPYQNQSQQQSQSQSQFLRK